MKKKNGYENKGFEKEKDDNLKSIVTKNNESITITLGNETDEHLGNEHKGGSRTFRNTLFILYYSFC